MNVSRSLNTVACLSLALLLFTTRHGAAQCAAGPILDPQGAGANNQTRAQNFLTLVDDLYSTPTVTRRLFFNGRWHQVPPWYKSSERCAEGDLSSYEEFTSPTFQRYLVNGDELSELAMVAALADDEQRMIEIHHTAEAMIAGSAHADLPCWLAKVENGVLSCLRTDTASDITARFGLAYLFAAQNPRFSPAWQAAFRNAAVKLVRAHLLAEYANFDPQTETCPEIAPTSREICDWIGGGGNSATRGSFESGNTHMWIGYFHDVARFLIAVAESESARDPALAARALERADQVVELWLGASRFNGSAATFGDKEFTWNNAVAPIQPHTLLEWDYDDAPRALGIGDVLRAVHLQSRGAPLSGAYARLSTWVQLLLAGDTQQPACSVIKYSQNGQPLQTCNAGFYENGLGAGLFTYHSTDLLDDKLDAALVQYRWADKVWSNDPDACFGIYRPIRPVKALATAIGLDAGAYLRCVQPGATPADFNGTRVSDWFLYRGGAWLHFGPATEEGGSIWTGETSSACIPAPADYNGDGEVDLSLKCGGAWHFYNADGSYQKGIWTGGLPGDLPVPADYDGDGDADVVVFRNGLWMFYDHGTGAYLTGIWTGPGSGAVPVPMDYDGDGRAEFSAYQSGAWHFYKDDGTYLKGIWTGGVAGDIPVPGNYHGLGREEVVIFRGGAWLFYDFQTGSTTGGVWTGAVPYGGQPLLPAPLDLDGDGTLELTIYAGGPWHFYKDDGTYLQGVWTGGVPGDRPISRRQL